MPGPEDLRIEGLWESEAELEEFIADVYRTREESRSLPQHDPFDETFQEGEAAVPELPDVE